MKHYNDYRKIMKFYQPSGTCESTISNPTYQEINIVHFQRDLSTGVNMKNLLGMLREWKKSYACIPDKLKVHHKSLHRNLVAKSALSDSPSHQDEEITFEITEDSMSFYQAQAHCNLNGKRLADPSTDVEMQMLINKLSVLPMGTDSWFEDRRAATTDTFCQGPCCSISLASGDTAFFGPSPDCIVGKRAVCMSGQKTTTTSITTTLKVDLPIVVRISVSRLILF